MIPFEEILNLPEYQSAGPEQRSLVEKEYATDFWKEVSQSPDYLTASKEKQEELRAVFDGRFPEGPKIRTAIEGGGFVAAAKQFAGQTIKGAGQYGADLIPGVSQDNAAIRYGQQLIEENPTKVQSLGDILDKPWDAVKESLGQMAPAMVGMAGVAGVGAGITAMSPLTGPAAPVVATAGQIVQWLGPMAMAALPSYSGIRDKQKLLNPDVEQEAKDIAMAQLGSVIVGAIEIGFGPQNWALNSFTKEGRAKLSKMFASTTLGGSILKAAAQGGLEEGLIEEGTQNPIEQIASHDNPLTKESLKDTAFGIAMGTIGGALTGAPAGGLTHVVSQRGPSIKTPEPPMTQSHEVEKQASPADILESESIDDAINAFRLSLEDKQEAIVVPEIQLPTVEPPQFTTNLRTEPLPTASDLTQQPIQEIREFAGNQADLIRNTEGPKTAERSAEVLASAPPVENEPELARIDEAKRFTGTEYATKDEQLKRQTDLEEALREKQPDFSRANGKPFSNENSLVMSAKQRGRDLSAYDIVKIDDGVIGVYNPNKKTDNNVITPALAKMSEELNAGTEKGVTVSGEGNNQTVTGGFPSTNPEWFKVKNIKEFDQIHGTEYASMVNTETFTSTMRALENGYPLTEKQQKVFDYINTVAKEKNQNDPELVAGSAYDTLTREGFEFHDPQQTAIGDIKPGDQFVIERNGIPEKITHKGFDDQGNAILQDGREMILDPFEQVDVIASKQQNTSTLVDNPKSVASGQDVNINPSEPQKEAGNYKKAHVNIDGLDISIENPIGSIRSGVDMDGSEWSQTMKSDYGYIKGSVGYDKDHVDTFIKPGYSGGNGDVYVVNQYNSAGKFDEHKAILGAKSETEAMNIYNSNYEPGWDNGKSIVRMTIAQFKEWSRSNAPHSGPIEIGVGIETKEADNQVTKQGPVTFQRQDITTQGKTSDTQEILKGHLNGMPKERVSTINKLVSSGKVILMTPEEAKAEAEKEGHTFGQQEGLDIIGMETPGRTIIVPANVPNGEMWGSFRHAIGVHVGQLLHNAPEFELIKKTIMRRQDEKSAMGEAIRRAKDMVPEGTDPSNYSEEIIAYMVSRSDDVGIVRRTIAIIKNMLTRLGISYKIFNDKDFLALADMAIKKEAYGVQTTANETNRSFNQFSQSAKIGIEKAKRVIGWSAQRIQDEITYSEYDKGETRAAVGFVNPRDFIKATTPGKESESRIAKETKPLNLEDMRDETQSMYLRVNDDNKIQSHEGRHRMVALAREGYDLVPIVIEYYNAEPRQEQESITLTGQEFEHGTGKDVTVSNIVPLIKDNYKTIRAMMGPSKTMTTFQRASNQSSTVPPSISFINKVKAQYDIPGNMEQIATYLWNQDAAIERVQKEISNQPIERDYATLRSLVGKKIAAEVKKFDREDLQPLLKYMADNKQTIKDVEELAYAQHAPERNLQMRRVRARGFIDRVMTWMTDKEKEPYQKRLGDIQDEFIMQDQTLNEKRDNNIDMMNDIVGEVSRQRAEVNKLQTALDNRVFTQAEINKGTPGYLQKRLDRMFERVTVREGIVQEWESIKDRLSGITDTEAQTIIDRLGNNKELQKSVDMLRAINQRSLERSLKDGEIDQEQYDAINNTYKYHVPLMREEETDGKLPTGKQGVGPLGTPYKVAAGSIKEVTNIFAHVIDRYQSAIARGQKLEAGRALYEMVKENPDPERWNIGTVDKAPHLDHEGNIRYYPTPQLSPEEMKYKTYVKVDGKKYIIEVPKGNKSMMRWMAALNRQVTELGPIIRASGAVTRVLAKLNTTLTPEFTLPNFIRDMQTAMINMSSTEARGLQGEVFGNIASSVKGIYLEERGQKSGQWGSIYRDAEANGAIIGWMQTYETVQNLSDKIESDFALLKGEAPGKELLMKLGGYIETVNISVENGVRIATYQALVSRGIPKAKAAHVASNLTVDFTRHGTAGPALNSLYMFANAGIQGNIRIIKALAVSPTVRKITGGIVVLGILSNILNSTIGGDDDDGESYYEKLKRKNPSLFERNMVFMIPGSGGKYFKVPMAYGYNAFFSLGNEIASASKGGKGSAVESSMRFMSTLMNTLNPIAASTLLQTIMPTIGDPFAQVMENKAWHGGPLMPELNPYVNQPDSARFFKNVNPVAKGVTGWLNDVTGGNAYKEGAISVSPETVDMIFETFTGGAGKLVKDLAGLPISVFSGEDVGANKVPIVRRFFGEMPKNIDSGVYSDNRKEMDVFMKELRNADRTERRELISDPLYKMVGSFQATESSLSVLFKQKKLIDSKKGDTAKIDQRIKDLQIRFNKKYNAMVRNVD
jgi:hypothetical protein